MVGAGGGMKGIGFTQTDLMTGVKLQITKKHLETTGSFQNGDEAEDVSGPEHDKELGIHLYEIVGH